MENIADFHAGIGVAWFCLSIPLILMVFFRFGRIWSLRNLDLLLLVAVGIGVLLVRYAPFGNWMAISWMLASTVILLARLLADGQLVKRPRIETNLNLQALTFLGLIGCAAVTVGLFIIPLPNPSQAVVEQGREVLHGEDAAKKSSPGPKSPLTSVAVGQTLELSQQVAEENGEDSDEFLAEVAVGILAGIAHLTVLAALIFIGVRHFRDWPLGLAAGVFYLLLPSTVLDPNSVTHVMCAALILWALALHRTAWAAGIFMGLACGALLYPVFLLPVWCVYYGRKRWWHFAGAMAGVSMVMFGGLALLSTDALVYLQQSLQLIADSVGFLVKGEVPVTWSITDDLYRIPIVVTFGIVLAALAVWPWQKRFEHLLAHTAAVIVGLQFWYPQQPGEYLTGYIPLVVLIAFRPRLPTAFGVQQAGVLRRDNGEPNPAPSREKTLVGVGNGSRLFR